MKPIENDPIKYGLIYRRTTLMIDPSYKPSDHRFRSAGRLHTCLGPDAPPFADIQRVSGLMVIMMGFLSKT